MRNYKFDVILILFCNSLVAIALALDTFASFAKEKIKKIKKGNKHD